MSYVYNSLYNRGFSSYMNLETSRGVSKCSSISDVSVGEEYVSRGMSQPSEDNESKSGSSKSKSSEPKVLNDAESLLSKINEYNEKISLIESEIETESFRGNIFRAEALMEQCSELELEKVNLTNDYNSMLNSALEYRSKLSGITRGIEVGSSQKSDEVTEDNSGKEVDDFLKGIMENI